MKSGEKRNAKIKYLLDFLREKKRTILLYISTLALFVGAGSLYHVENIGKLLYAALLATAVWTAAGVAQGVGYVRRRQELETVRRHFEQSGELLTGPLEDREETAGIVSQLTELLKLTDQSRRQEHDLWEQRAADQRDYYMLWTHQIKTPISALKLLLEKEDGGRNGFLMREELFKIDQYAEMALTYQRLNSMSSDLVLQEYELTAVLRQSVRKFSVLFINKGLSVEVPEQEAWALTDKKWFAFCLEQLLLNSVKYTETGGIRFVIEESEENLRLTVADTGIGIREEDLPRIFEKGFTGYNGRLQKKSTGIGLYLCRQVFDRLGIAVRAESRPGEGTRMLLTLPKPYKNVSYEKEM